MDTKQAIDILRDEDKYMASPENAENGIWTHTDLTVVEANDIANLIERMQAREAELVKALEDWLSIHGSGFCAIGTCYKCRESMPSISHAMCESCAIEQAKKALADWRDKQNV